METRAHHVLIGLFTVLVTAGALLFGLWLAKSGRADDTKVYEVIFREAVTGLSIGNGVLYSGIRVGSVERIEIDPDDPRQVVVRIRVARDTPIKQDTHAQLILTNITGNYEIQLSGGSPESPPLTAARRDEVPRIVADPSPLSQLTGSGQALLTQISTLLSNANRLLSPDNTEHIARTLENLSRFSNELATQSTQIGTGLQSLAEASRQANEVMAEAVLLLRRTNSLIDREGRTFVGNAAQTMDSLQRATASLERLLLENETALSNGLQGLNSLGPAVDELRRTLMALRAVAQRIEEEPSTFLFGHESVREFQP